MSFEIVLISLLALIVLVRWVEDRRQAREKVEAVKRMQKSIGAIAKAFVANPFDSGLRGQLMASMALQSGPGGTGIAYRAVLDALAQHPLDSGLRQLALEAGRVHFGKASGGATTLEDEQRIMNDIAVRSMLWSPPPAVRSAPPDDAAGRG